MWNLIKAMGLLPLIGKLAHWAIDRWITNPKERDAAKARFDAKVNSVTDRSYSEAQDIAQQWDTIQEIKKREKRIPHK